MVAAAQRRHPELLSMPTDREQELMLELIRGIKESCENVREGYNQLRTKIEETERYARSSFSMMEQFGDKLAALEKQVHDLKEEAKASTLDIVRFKTQAALVSAGVGVAVTILTAWVIHVLKF